jgi:hypothetical protein
LRAEDIKKREKIGRLIMRKGSQIKGKDNLAMVVAITLAVQMFFL